MRVLLAFLIAIGFLTLGVASLAGGFLLSLLLGLTLAPA